MRRGEIYRVYNPPGDTKQYRSFVIVSRQVVIDDKSPKLVCAPIFTSGSGLSTQVTVGQNEGLKHDCWIVCDDLRSVDKSALTHYVGSISSAKLAELDRALSAALDL